MIDNKAANVIPDGMAELVFCLIGKDGELLHRYEAGCIGDAGVDDFRLLDEHNRLCKNCLMETAFNRRRPLSFTISCGENRSKDLHILPYETESGKWQFACLQLTPEDETGTAATCDADENRLCLLFTDSTHHIRAVNARVPREFGFKADDLCGKSIQERFDPPAPELFQPENADREPSVISGFFRCPDGGRLDVEVTVLPAPAGYTLYLVCDCSPRNQLEKEVIEVSNRERRRIGQELHDSLGQLMTGMSLLSRSLANKLKRDGHAGSSDAAELSELADQAGSQLHYVSLGLMPAEIVRRGLGYSLKELARITARSCGVVCNSLVDDTLDFQDISTETHLYRIAQEAVNNAVRHSGSSRIDILVSRQSGVYQLSVVDNGRWKETESDGTGIGLKTMQYRAQAIGGELRIEHGENRGTTVRCLLAKEI